MVEIFVVFPAIAIQPCREVRIRWIEESENISVFHKAIFEVPMLDRDGQFGTRLPVLGIHEDPSAVLPVSPVPDVVSIKP